MADDTPDKLPRSPGVVLSARALASQVRQEQRSQGELVARMKRDYQVSFADRILRSSVQAVEVTIGGEADDSLVESVKTLWWRHLKSMLDCIADGRVAFEIVWGLEGGVTVPVELVPLPYKATRLVLDEMGRPDCIILSGGKADIRIPSEKSFWLALDATAEYPHGQSRFVGAPHEVWMDRQDAIRLRRLLITRYAITGYRGYAPAQVVDENGNAIDGIASMLDALAALDAGGHCVLPGDRDAAGERQFEVTDTPKANDPGPLDETLDGMDQDQLQAFGIPPKTVMEGDSVGSFAMVAVQRMVLDAVVDDILTQIESGFNQYICDAVCEANGIAAGSIRVSHETLVKRGNQILAQAIEAIVASPEMLVGLLSSVDAEQLLKATALPVAEGGVEAWKLFLKKFSQSAENGLAAPTAQPETISTQGTGASDASV